MDTVLVELVKQSPLAVLVYLLWRQSADERREWRSWFEAQQRELQTVIAANTAALSRNTEAFGEVTASRMNCPAAEGRFQRRGGNGSAESR